MGNPGTTDYNALITAHYECDEASGAALLNDPTLDLGADWTDTATNVGTLADGAAGLARGPCGSGSSPGFVLTNGAGPFDFRGATDITFLFWFRMNTIGAADNVIWESRENPIADQALFIRAHHRFTGSPNPSSPVFFMSDGVGGLLSVTAFPGGRTMVASPVWNLLGISYDATLNEMRIFWADETGAQHFETAVGVVGGFQHTSTTTLMGLGRSNLTVSNSGLDGDIDHCDWFNGYAFEQAEFVHFYNLGVPRAFPAQYAPDVINQVATIQNRTLIMNDVIDLTVRT